MGSVNLVAYDARTKTVHGSNFIYKNSYDTIRYFLENSRELGLRPTLQIFDPSFLRAALDILRARHLDRTIIAQILLGWTGTALRFAAVIKESGSVPRHVERCSVQLVWGDARRGQSSHSCRRLSVSAVTFVSAWKIISMHEKDS